MNHAWISDKAGFRRLLLFLAVLGSASIFYATYALGAGLGEDSAKYLSVAENLAAGRGFYDYVDDPLTQWPPLYPFLLAILHVITGLDVYLIGWSLNILIFGSIIWASGLLFQRLFPQTLGLATLGALLIASSVAIVSIAVNISTDPLFILLVILFFLSLEEYLRTNSFSALTKTGLFVVAATLTRYAGLSLVLTGGLVILYAKRANLRYAFLWSLGFMLSTGLPLLSWSFFHNYRINGSLFGRHLPSSTIGNLTITIEKIAGWFLPDLVLEVFPPFIILATIVAILILIASKNWRDLRDSLASLSVLPHVVFFAIYFGMLLFNTSYSEARYPGFDRIHVAILPSLLVIMLSTAEIIGSGSLTKLPQKSHSVILFVTFVAVLIFPFYRFQKYVRNTATNGDHIYNFVVSPALHDSELISYLQSIPPEEKVRVYSNNEAVAWFYLRQPILRMPRPNMEGIWPAVGEMGIVVWFKDPLDYKPDKLSPDGAFEAGWLILPFISDDGNVYILNRTSR